MSGHEPTSHHDHGALAEMLDLDAEVFAPAMASVHEDIRRAADSPVRSILDIGAGTGTGTFGLLQHFTEAHATAVDVSEEMLTHLTQRAERLGLSERVTVRRADLDEAWPAMEAVDLAWASTSLHHLSDPDRTLTQIAEAIRPGGLLAVVELDGLPRFLPDRTAGAAVELRAHRILESDRAADMPAMGSDWGQRLTRARLVVEQHRAIALDLVPPLPPATGRYAAATLARIRGAVVDRLDAAERAVLDTLLDGGPDDVRHRDDLRVTAQRWSWVARRPVV